VLERLSREIYISVVSVCLVGSRHTHGVGCAGEQISSHVSASHTWNRPEVSEVVDFRRQRRLGSEVSEVVVRRSSAIDGSVWERTTMRRRYSSEGM
jgi:hypothetical protein